jgi:hypothetical protein
MVLVACQQTPEDTAMRAGFALGCIALLVFAAGCASFDGVLQSVERPVWLPREGGPVNAVLVVWPAEVEDQDADRDFTPLIGEFSRTYADAFVDYARNKRVFQLVQTRPQVGAYQLRSKAVVRNYRKDRGGAALALLGGIFLPPILGMAWSLPVGFGDLDLEITWELVSPAGTAVELKKCAGDFAAAEARYLGYRFEDCWDSVLEQAAVEGATGRAAALVRADGEPPAPASVPAATGPRLRGVIIAVFDIDDPSKSFNVSPLSQLADYLAARLSEISGAKVVPRDQLRARLKQEKQEAYRACYDQGCQIELGKAVAAQKSLSTKIIKVADRCALTSVLYDLKTETADQAATVQSDCAEAKLLEALDQLLAKLTS